MDALFFQKRHPAFILCSYCCEDDQKNRDGVPEEFISCADCGSSGKSTNPFYSECVLLSYFFRKHNPLFTVQ